MYYELFTILTSYNTTTTILNYYLYSIKNPHQTSYTKIFQKVKQGLLWSHHQETATVGFFLGGGLPPDNTTYE